MVLLPTLKQDEIPSPLERNPGLGRVALHLSFPSTTVTFINVIP